MDTIYYNAQDDEFWKDINDYEGLYMVSNLGRVKSLNYRNTGKEGFLKPRSNGGGYLQVSLCKNGEVSERRVHILVMQAFKGECPEGYEVDHLDWNPSNNRLSNLRYLLAKENNSRKSPEWHENIVEANKKKACCKPVGQYTIDGVLVKTWKSIKDAARELGIDHSHISKCCKGKYKSTGGFKWQYATKI